LLADLTAFQLAGLLYLGGAVGIAPRVLWRRERRPPLDGITRTRLGGAVILGGVVAPVLLLFGLRVAPAGSVSLLLNFEVAAIAGMTNLVMGAVLEPLRAPLPAIAAALGVGALSYGASIALYISAAHQAGTIRAQSVFAAAPFFGAVVSWVALREPVESMQLLAGGIFVAGVVLLTFDRHSHAHAHGPLSHVHSHRHDDGHHAHAHPDLPASARHTHWHDHAPTEHAHPHVADLHHRHGHGSR